MEFFSFLIQLDVSCEPPNEFYSSNINFDLRPPRGQTLSQTLQPKDFLGQLHAKHMPSSLREFYMELSLDLNKSANLSVDYKD